jgi:hypothetical protein
MANFFQSDFFAGAGTGGMAAGTVAWVKRYEIDFTAQSTHDFKASGATTLTALVGNDATYTPINDGTATTMSVGAGGALINWGGGTGLWNSVTATAPALRATISDLIGSYGVDDWLAIQVYTESGNIPNDTNNNFQFTCIDPATVPDSQMRGGQADNSGGQQIFWGTHLWQGGAVLSVVDVLEFQCRGIRGEWCAHQIGAWGGSFPTPQSSPTYRGPGTSDAAGVNALDAATDTVTLTGEVSGGSIAYDRVWNRLAIWSATITTP